MNTLLVYIALSIVTTFIYVKGDRTDLSIPAQDEPGDIVKPRKVRRVVKSYTRYVDAV